MLAFRICSAVAATALLAAAPAWAGEEDVATEVVINSAEAAPIEAHAVWNMNSDYWLGVVASPPSPAMQAQLKLPKDQGLVVDTLLAEGPAAKAGVKQYDILLKGNDKPLSGLHDLLQLTNEVKEGKLKLELLRAGKHESVTVTPAKRPEHAIGEMHMLHHPEVAGAGWIGNVDPNAPGVAPMHFRVIRPGQILPPGGPMASAPGVATVNLMVHIKTKLADGSNVEILRKGPETAKVTVTHDKDKWEGTSSDLSKIPEKIRPEIERLLQPALFDRNVFFTALGVSADGGGAIVADGGPNAFLVGPGGPGLPGGMPVPTIVAHAPMAGLGGAMPAPGLSTPFVASPEVEKRLSEMQKQIDELQLKVEAFQGKEKKAAEKKAAAKP